MFSREPYGQPRMYAELRDDGWQVNHKHVRRLMRLDGLQGATRRKKWCTTKRAKDARPAPDLVERDFSVDGPDQLWVADITYVPTSSGFLYLAVVVDAWSRRVVGWSMKTHLKTDVVLDALSKPSYYRRRSLKNQAEARMAVFDFIEGWYNPRRRHSALGQMSPINYEKEHAQVA